MRLLIIICFAFCFCKQKTKNEATYPYSFKHDSLVQIDEGNNIMSGDSAFSYKTYSLSGDTNKYISDAFDGDMVLIKDSGNFIFEQGPPASGDSEFFNIRDTISIIDGYGYGIINDSVHLRYYGHGKIDTTYLQKDGTYQPKITSTTYVEGLGWKFYSRSKNAKKLFKSSNWEFGEGVIDTTQKMHITGTWISGGGGVQGELGRPDLNDMKFLKQGSEADTFALDIKMDNPSVGAIRVWKHDTTKNKK